MKDNSRTLLKDIAYEKIKNYILTGVYSPGSFLSEKKLIDELNMSKTPIKSAITKLESEGFVQVSSKRGIFVNDLTIEKVNNIFDLRLALETFNCEKIYPNKHPKLRELENNLIDTKIAIQEYDINRFAQLDNNFHLIISEIAGNKEITSILINYNSHLLQITRRHLKQNPELMKRFYKEHMLIFQNLKENDEKCVESMKNHLIRSKSLLFQ